MVHSTKQLQQEADWLSKAIHHEREGEFTEAVKAYHKILSIDPVNIKIYDKLMRLHRDLKEYEKELAVINKAIKALEKFYQDRQPVYNKKVASLSKALLKATGLADKKGNNVYQPDELKRWKKRRGTAMKRLGISE